MTKRLHLLLVCLLWAMAAAVAPEARDQRGPANRPPDQGQITGEFRIGLGDVLEILVWNDENLSRTVSVRPDGRISVPLLNDVTAAGMTPMQLRDILAKGFSRYRSEPEVSVIVREIQSLKFSVMGQVKTPGRFDLKGRITVIDALAQAGGFTDFAKKDRIVVWRNDNGQMRPVGFDYQRLLTDLDATQNFFVMPGDIIVVP
jgi:polysaccharide export outer membrane protein